MPKIKDEDINSKYFEKYLLTTITYNLQYNKYT